MIERVPAASGLSPESVIDVEDDPRQLQVLADDRVRVFETVLRPGQSTALHRHWRRTVSVYMTSGRLRCAANRDRHPAPAIGHGIALARRLATAFRFAVRHEMRAFPGLVTIRSSGDLPAVHRLLAAVRNPSPIRLVNVELEHAGGRARRVEGMRTEHQDDALHVLRLPTHGESAAELPDGGVLVTPSAPGTAAGPRLLHVPAGGVVRLERGAWRFTGPGAVLVVV